MSFQGHILNAIGSANKAAGIMKGLNTANQLLQRQEQAEANVKQTQEAKQKQRRNFMEYLRKQQLQWGGTVGDLPDNLQKTIAKQYSKSDRQKLMNQMDREASKK